MKIIIIIYVSVAVDDSEKYDVFKVMSEASNPPLGTYMYILVIRTFLYSYITFYQHMYCVKSCDVK